LEEPPKLTKIWIFGSKTNRLANLLLSHSIAAEFFNFLLKGKTRTFKVRLFVRVARWIIFKTKNPSLGKFWRALDWKIFFAHWEYLMDIWDILRPFGTFCVDLVHFYRFGLSCTRKNLATLLFVPSILSPAQSIFAFIETPYVRNVCQHTIINAKHRS
jgi:hypothetical protein